ncbi:unnamed protein product [Moneuplotes crassus]|uniref:Uncharacterized protein n=1 Tax=Euplotes crassus TaxID=5936 RepID=A0AAD1TZV3_EUPCR|nr:unnamed protein product [Moneuplotes crassus]
MSKNVLSQGPRSFKEVQEFLKHLLALNKSAMMKLKYQKYRSCHEILQNARDLVTVLARNKATAQSPKFCSVASITYNNLGCYYQKKNQNSQSIKYYQKSLTYTKNIEGDEVNLASTYLNICSLFSQMGDHEEAYRHGEVALKLLPIAYKKHKEQTDSNQLQESTERPNDSGLDNLLMTIVIAYYNVATECEFLGNNQEALKNFIRGYEWGSKTFGKDDDLVKKIRKCIFQIKKVLYKSGERGLPSTSSSKFSLMSKQSVGSILRKSMKNSNVLKKINPRSFSEKTNADNSIKRSQGGNDVSSLYNSSEITDIFTAHSAKNSSVSQKLRNSHIYQRSPEINQTNCYLQDERTSSRSKIGKKIQKGIRPFQPNKQLRVASLNDKEKGRNKSNASGGQEQAYLPAVPIIPMYGTNPLSTSMNLENKKLEIPGTSSESVRKSMKNSFFSPKTKKVPSKPKMKGSKRKSNRYAPTRPNIEVIVHAHEMNRSLESIHEESKQDSGINSATQERYLKTRQRYSNKIITKRKTRTQSKISFFETNFYNRNMNMNLTQEGIRRRSQKRGIDSIKSRINNISKVRNTPLNKEISGFDVASFNIKTTDNRNRRRERMNSSADSIDLVDPTISLPSHVRTTKIIPKIKKNVQ